MRRYRTLISIAMIVILVTIVAVRGVRAYTPPGQSSDNATDVIIWHGDSANVTLSGSANITLSGSANITIPGLDKDLEDAAKAGADELAAKLLAMLQIIMEAAIVFSINYFAYRFRDRWVCVAGGFALILYGFTLWNDWWYLSILLVLVGIYNLGKSWGDKKAWERE